jgi:hypothetical protein
MARMVRKQIVIEAHQERALSQRAAALGVSQSELVREAIDVLLSGAAPRSRQQRAWDELLAGVDEARASGVGSGGRRFGREELHER